MPNRLRILATIYLIVVVVVAALSIDSGLWGAYHLDFLPIQVAVTLIVVSMMLIWLPRKVRSHLDRRFKQLSRYRYRSMGLWGSGAAILALLGAVKSENHLLGDCYQRLSYLAEPFVLSATETGDLLLHKALYEVIGDAALSYLLIGLLSGALFLIVAYRHSRYLTTQPVGRAAVIFLFLGIAQMQFFAGYAESYAVMTALLALFLHLGSIAVEFKKYVWWALGILLLAGGFHISALAMLPGIIYLFWLHGNRSGSSTYKASAIALVIISAAGAAALFLKLGGDMFVPITATAVNPYSLFSKQHLLDLLNVFLLVAPLPLMLIAARIRNPEGCRSKDSPDTLFLFIASMSGILFSAMIDPKLGAARDWDLLALYGVPLVFLSAKMSQKHLAEAKHSAVIFSIGFAVILMHTAPWIYSNSRSDLTVAQLKSIIADDVHYSPEYYHGERLVSWGHILEEKFGDLEEKERCFRLRLEGKPDDQRSWLVYAVVSFELGKMDQAASAIKRVTDLEKLYDHQLENLALMQLQLGDLASARRTIAFASEKYSDGSELLFLKGLAAQLENDFGAACQFYGEALKIDGSNVDLLLNYAAVAINTGGFALADDLLRRAERLPELTSNDRTDIDRLRSSIATMRDASGKR
ncbi:MAG: hypothetical protein ABIK83_10450 [Candidatus Zixiibacteriota bacterium]